MLEKVRPEGQSVFERSGSCSERFPSFRNSDRTAPPLMMEPTPGGAALFRALDPLVARGALVFRDREFQSGPGVVDGANLDVDKTQRKAVLRTTTSVRSVQSRKISSAIRPRSCHPARKKRAVAAQFCCKPRGFGCEQMHHVGERSIQPWRDHCIGRQFADDVVIGRRSARDKNKSPAGCRAFG